MVLCSFCCISTYAQQGGARATGEIIGRWLVYVILAFLLFRFIIKPLFRKKNK